jgi:hypothetical protein
MLCFLHHFNKLNGENMFYAKDHKTYDMFDCFEHLGPKRRGLLDSTWAKLFRDEILPNLPVHLLKTHYDPNNGRPTNELFAMMGVMILQQMHDLTDEQTVEQFCFNIQWHFALNITNVNDAASYVCPRSIWTMRRIMTENNLYTELFEGVSDHLGRMFKIDTTLQRLDSVHLFSNMRHLGRIRLFATTITKFLKNLKRHHKTMFNDLSEEMKERYLSKRAESAFSMVKPSDSSRTLEELGQDLFSLVERFNGHKTVVEMTSYGLLVRLMAEQCTVTEDQKSKKRTIAVKPNREVASDSLQNPSDADATYDGHKGKGYQTQVAETYSTCKEADQRRFNIITHIEVEPAHKSDAHAVVPYLDQTEKRGVSPSQVLADSLYGSDSNTEEALKRKVELVAPVMGGPPSSDTITLADFTLTEKDAVTACPAGHAPKQMKKKGDRLAAVFCVELCEQCPKKAECPVKDGKRGRYLRYNSKVARLARRRAVEKTAAFREKYRFRSGVEATMSEFDRRTGVKHLRVRGLAAVRFSVFLKATGLNILRAAAFRAQTIRTTKKQIGFAVIKEQLTEVFRLLGMFPLYRFQNGAADVSYSLRTAA